MKVVALYHPKSDHAVRVEDYAKEYKRFHGRRLELISLEDHKGADLAKMHDITVYPAILAIDNNGQVANIWQGGLLPLMDELDAYFQPA